VGIGINFANYLKLFLLMLSFYRFVLLTISTVCMVVHSYGQYYDTSKPVKVAVFIPLYADDVFNGSSDIPDKENLPKNVLPGLEFYNGVMMAIDSLNTEGSKVEISIYDLKQDSKSLAALLKSSELNNVGLIIAALTNTAELKLFADQALIKNIPLISATYPNYVGVSQNPFLVVLNSSFQAHLDGLYKHMQRFYGSQNIIAVTRKGATEEYVKNYFTSLNKLPRSVPLKLKWVTIDDALSNIKALRNNLDSTKNNVVFVASPLEKFGLNIVVALSLNEQY
jgi:hypothetical protein